MLFDYIDVFAMSAQSTALSAIPTPIAPFFQNDRLIFATIIYETDAQPLIAKKKMKKLFVALLLAMLGVAGAQAQKTTVKIQDTQARLLDVKSNAYVRPLVVELKVDTSKGRVVDEWPLTKEQVEVEMNGDLTNIRSWGVYKSSQKHNADVIVAATFNFQTDEKPGFYKLTVICYPASFVNWETAKESDYEWIRMEKTVTTSDREKISAIVK